MTPKLLFAAASVSLLWLGGTLEAVGVPLTASDLDTPTTATPAPSYASSLPISTGADTDVDFPEFLHNDPGFVSDANRARDDGTSDLVAPRRGIGSDPVLFGALFDAPITDSSMADDTNATSSAPSTQLSALMANAGECCGGSGSTAFPGDDASNRGGILSGRTLAVLGAGLVAVGLSVGWRTKGRHRRVTR
jgi:hypothetical protein